MSRTAEMRDRRSRSGHGGLPLGGYVVVTFAWTWSLWWAAAATGRAFTDPAVALLFGLGGLGPLVGAALLMRCGGPRYRRDLLRRVWDPSLIPGSSWLLVIAVAAVPATLGAVGGRLVGGGVAPDLGGGAVVAVVAFALAAGLIEEPGWRGAAWDAWRSRTQPWLAAVGIGALWALWHLPLYFIDGSYQHGLGFGSLRFWSTSLVLVPLGVLYVWLTCRSGGSVLVVIIAHAGSNITGELVARSTAGDLIALLVIAAAASVVIAGTTSRPGGTGRSALGSCGRRRRAPQET